MTSRLGFRVNSMTSRFTLGTDGAYRSVIGAYRSVIGMTSRLGFRHDQSFHAFRVQTRACA